MLIFNTTFHLDDSILDECLAYLKEKFIPQALTGNLLEQPCLARIERQHEEHGVSYALQFKAKDMDTLDKWAREIGEPLQEDLYNKFGNKISGFVTLMEEIPL